MILFPAVEIQHDYNLTRLQVYCYANAKKKQNRATVLNQYIKCFLQPSWNRFNIVCTWCIQPHDSKIKNNGQAMPYNHIQLPTSEPNAYQFAQAYIPLISITHYATKEYVWGMRVSPDTTLQSNVVYTKIIRPRKNYYN